MQLRYLGPARLSGAVRFYLDCVEYAVDADTLAVNVPDAAAPALIKTGNFEAVDCAPVLREAEGETTVPVVKKGRKPKQA